MRDHTKLKAFHLADELCLQTYRSTTGMPRDELFGLRSQLRRAAISVPSNIVEGCARRTQSDYLHFLDVAFGSLKELEYQVSVAGRLGYLQNATYGGLAALCVEVSKVLAALIRSLRPSGA